MLWGATYETRFRTKNWCVRSMGSRYLFVLFNSQFSDVKS